MKSERRVLLLEFASRERWVYNSRFYPFIKGCAESLGLRTLWLSFGADMKTAKLARTSIVQYRDLPPGELEVLRARVRDLRPTHVVSTHTVSKAVMDCLRAESAKGMTILTVSDPDQPSWVGGKVPVSPPEQSAKTDWLLSWLGETTKTSPHFGKYLAGTFRPSYDAVIGNARFLEYKPHLIIMGGVLCDHAAKLSDNEAYRGLDLSACQHDFGCGFCTHDRNPNSDLRADPLAAAEEQFRRIVETAGEGGRDFGAYDVFDIRLFGVIDRFFDMILRAGVRPGTFYFEPRIDKFLASADKLETLLPRLKAAGHRVSLFRMGAESLVEEENELYNKHVTLAQIDAATARSRALAEKFPGVFECDPTYGYITCSPWTTLEMFEKGVERARTRGFDPKGVWLYTPLLFYIDAPLTELARREGGILREKHEDLELLYEPAVNESGFDSFLPWKFKDERMAAAFAVIVRFCAAALRDKYPDTLFEGDELYERLLSEESGMPFYERPDVFASAVIAAVKGGAPPSDREGLLCAALDAYRDLMSPPGASAKDAKRENLDWSELTLTRRCNQRCFFCYEEARGIARDPDLDEVKRMLRETQKRADMVVLCGKEVVLRRDILDIVAYAKSIGLQVAVFSNGQAFSRPGLIQELVEAGCEDVVVSFHFPDRESFARGARVHPRGFQMIVDGLRNISRYFAEHANRDFGVSTETGMFAFNAGRLAEVRRTLRAALGEKGWAMRLGSLLPTKIYDVGMPEVMEPFAERRAELAEFVKTHPAHIPLNFVKVPLCMLPPSAVHKSLDVQHVHEAALMTFNHAEMDKVTVDTLSPSLAADVTEKLRAHPYRWVCRSCDLVSLCRFERVSWVFPFFEPTRAQKPEPIPGLTAAKVLARLGPAPAALERARSIGRELAKIRYPEELLLDALRGEGGPALKITGAWIEREPVMVVEVRGKGRAVPLRLSAPRRKETAVPLHAVIDYLDVAPAHGTLAAAAPLLDAVAAKRLPDIESWSRDQWFDRPAAELLRSAWRAFGRELWPGVGKIAGWSVDAVSLLPTAQLLVALRHPGSARVELTWGLSSGEPRAALSAMTCPAGAAPPEADLARLAAALAAPEAPKPTKDSPLAARVRESLFNAEGRPVALGGHVAASVEPGPGRFVVVTLKSHRGEDPVIANVEPLEGAARYFKAAGDLAFGYSDSTPLKSPGQLRAFAALIARLSRRARA